ncbi:hypothetical protein BJ165DRAFT_1523917 [Panaeolus papilionaceus]|nr:hypothetical protein BJ165DRAFT_1523917 [Panaeolus papilionaceus]
MPVYALVFMFSSLLWTVKSTVTQPRATCLPGPTYAWTSNTLGQSPCDLASTLGAICNNGDWSVPSILQDNNPDWHYVDPGTDNSTANPCTCSTVLYSLMAACTYCQGATFEIESWSQYDALCNITYLTSFPLPLPQNIAIPRWAYLNITGDKFDPGVAYNFRSSIMPDITANTSFPLSPIDDNQHPNLNVKVVVGSVLGGFLALACIACVIRRIRLKGKKKRKIPGDPSLVFQDCIPYPTSPPPTPPPAKLSREQRFDTPGSRSKYHTSRTSGINPILVDASNIPPAYILPTLQPPSYESVAGHEVEH